MIKDRFKRFVGVAVIGFAMAMVFGACSSSPSTASASPSPARTPRGNPLPAQLQGDWALQADAAGLIAGGLCSKPYTIATCMFKLTFTGTTYTFATNVPEHQGGGGDVVVNGNQLAFFNGQACGLQPPAGVGHYTWTVTGTVLRLTPVDLDPCPRQPYLANQDYVRVADG
jgi:hypothetical protein